MSYWRHYPRFLTPEQLGADDLGPCQAVYHATKFEAYMGTGTRFWRDDAPWDEWEHHPWDETGLGGRKVTFRLDDGTTRTVKGPWNSFHDHVKTRALQHRHPLRILAATVRRKHRPGEPDIALRGVICDLRVVGHHEAGEVLAEQLACAHPGKRLRFVVYHVGGTTTWSQTREGP